MLKPSQSNMVIARRRKAPTEMIFEGGFKIALPEQYLRGNNGLSQEYRIVDVLSIANKMDDPDIQPGKAYICHELDELKLGFASDPDLIKIPAVCLLAEAVWS